MVTELFAAYRADPGLMNAGWGEGLAEAEPARSRHIADYIAGMTDRYATRIHRQICGKATAKVLGA